MNTRYRQVWYRIYKKYKALNINRRALDYVTHNYLETRYNKEDKAKWTH